MTSTEQLYRASTRKKQWAGQLSVSMSTVYGDEVLKSQSTWSSDHKAHSVTSLCQVTAPLGRTHRHSNLPDGAIITQYSRASLQPEMGSDDVFNDVTDSEAETTKRSWTRRRKLYEKFRLVARMAVFCTREGKAHILRNKVFDELTPFIRTLHFHDYTAEDDDLLFDPTKFKANKQLRISDEAKRILMKPPQERTTNELHYAQIYLRNLKCYAEYPVRMQKKIVRVGQYEKYEAKRVILRQGHPATAFYFILSGSVVVMVYEDAAQVAKPVAHLTRGMTFGELAIINGVRRQSTVIAKKPVELLSIDVWSFREIFMLGGVKNIRDPDHQQFLESLEFLRGWPTELMETSPQQCIFHYFKRGDVLVRDSSYSNWIYVVKSGSLSVLKKLKRVEAFDRKPKEEAPTAEQRDREKKLEILLRNKQRRYILPEIKVPLQSAETVDAVLEQKLQLPNINETTNGDGKAQLTVRQSRKPRKLGVTEQSKTDQRKKEKNGGSQPKQDEPQKTDEEEQEVKEEMEGRQQVIRTITSDWDMSRFRGRSSETEADLDPEFIRVQTLTKSHIFGLSETVLGQQAGLCVVSDGAECIMLDKAFYLESAPDTLIRHMRQQCCPYPAEEDLQDSLQVSVDWSAYRNSTYKDAMRRLALKRSQRDSAR